MLTLDKLNEIRDTLFAKLALRVEPLDTSINHVLVCGGPGCLLSRADIVEEQFRQSIAQARIDEQTEVIRVGCFGLCEAAPAVIIYPEGTFYEKIKPEDVDTIVKKHLVEKQPVTHLVHPDAFIENKLNPAANVNFFAKQTKIALKLCGVVDPEKIEDYIAFDGYQALAKVITKMTPAEVVEVIKASGLRGRGGGGFPVGLKWEFTARSESEIKYVACNADEGDPGAFMDRSIIEGVPHAIIEAMAIAGYAVGAAVGYIYVRAEYPIAVKRLEIAMQQARQQGLLGEKVLGTDFNFDLEIRLGAGAFVCGEETALLNSIEGKRGMPRPRPPFPATKGLWEKPTLLNNVETYANIPQIILKGASWFASIGTEKSKGTKVFALAGKIKNTGLVEIPMGTTLAEIIYDIGGGMPDGKQFKAVQTGGPSGGCIPAQYLHTEIDYDNLLELGSMMGSGGMIVLDEDNCMVDIAKFFLEFTVEESCGKCGPCRIGTKRMLEILEKITAGEGTLAHIDELERLAMTTTNGSLCGLGQSAANPVTSTLRHFKEEYIAHVVDKKCPAKACSALKQYVIDQPSCIGCTLCSRVCPVNAITGARKEPHYIDPLLCINCGACAAKCKFNAIKLEA